MIRLFSFLAMALLVMACTNDTENQDITNLTPTEKSAKIIAADNQFGFEIFQKIINVNITNHFYDGKKPLTAFSLFMKMDASKAA